MYRLAVVLLGGVLAWGCASSHVSGQCDPAEEACACDPQTACPTGYVCGPSGTCVVDVDAGVDGPSPDAPPGKQFGEPCTGNRECDSQICIFVGTGGRCTRLCADDCPTDWGCFGVIDVIDPGQIDNVCVPVVDQLCSPCTGDGECTQIGMDRCLTYPDGDQYCSRDCSTVSCPTGYTCTPMVLGGTAVKQCVPNSGACDCSAANTGMMETCTITTPFATTCAGMRTCTGATGWGACQPPSTTDDPDGSYQDANCDGIDGDVARGVFVAGGGANTPTCGLTSTTPCQTISYGIVRAATAGRNQVFVQAGTYNEVVVLVNGINVWGGYDFGWQRAGYATPGHRVEIIGAQDNAAGGDGEYLAVRAHDLIVPVTLGDLVITGPAAVGTVGGNGRSSYAVHVDAATVRLERVQINGGAGATGDPGSAGTDAVIVDAQAYMNGTRGGDGARPGDVCNTSTRGAGGPAGTNTCTGSPSTRAVNAGAGGRGGTQDTSCTLGVCSSCDATPGDNGGAASYRNGSFGAPGQGGSGATSCGPTTGGGPGEVTNGGRGTGGAGATLSNGYWYGASGSAGTTGENGGGGGGGGGAGGCDNGTDAYGGGGGGGGAGGCAARGGGGGGGGGGGSFGVFAVNSASVTISGCALARGAAGAGGPGGTGGRGQSGGAGNSGGSNPGGGAAMASPGGNGAHGGHGGGGGGGQGGRSVGLGWTPGSTVTHDCTITGGALGTGGAGGAHAPTAPAAERDGADGQNGTNGTLQTTRACASATSC